jgi:peptidoglycan hydrolase CwlO-like protein
VSGVAGGVRAGPLTAGNAPSQTQGLLPTNITLLQPGSGYFRLSDALNTLDQSGIIQQMQSSIDSLTTSVTTLQTQMTQTIAAVTTLQQQVFTLQGQMTTAQGNITTLQGQMTTANDNISALQVNVTALENAITSINGQLNGITFSNVVEAVPPAGLSGRFGVTIQGVAMSIGLYAP